MSKSLRWFAGILIVFLLGSAGRCFESHRSATTLIGSKYEIRMNIKNTIRIVHLSDLHNGSYGEDNTDLIRKITGQDPDIILMTGDMINGNEKTTEVVLSLIRKLVRIAPVYYSYGNHEKEWELRFQRDLAPSLEKAGAIVLDRKYIDTMIHRVPVRIAGYYGYYRAPVMTSSDAEEKIRETAWCDEFEDTTRTKLLLCHIPTSFLDWEYRDEYDAGLVFCGHYHGGQIRIPGIGGLYAPYVGWFPQYTRGYFEGERSGVVLTAGLGSDYRIPRINNPGEFVTVDLIPNLER